VTKGAGRRRSAACSQPRPALVAGWKRELDALGAGFASGEARVDPKKHLETCRYCDLKPLCRVYERVNALEEEGEEE